MTNHLLVDAGPHRKTNIVCLMDRQGQEIAPRFTVDNNRLGTHASIQRVAQQVIDGDFDAIHIAFHTHADLQEPLAAVADAPIYLSTQEMLPFIVPWNQFDRFGMVAAVQKSCVAVNTNRGRDQCRLMFCVRMETERVRSPSAIAAVATARFVRST